MKQIFFSIKKFSLYKEGYNTPINLNVFKIMCNLPIQGILKMVKEKELVFKDQNFLISHIFQSLKMTSFTVSESLLIQKKAPITGDSLDMENLTAMELNKNRRLLIQDKKSQAHFMLDNILIKVNFVVGIFKATVS